MTSVQSTEITIRDVYHNMSDGKKFFVNCMIYYAITHTMPTLFICEGLKEYFNTFTEDEKKVTYYLAYEAYKRKDSFAKWCEELDKMEGEAE